MWFLLLLLSVLSSTARTFRTALPSPRTAWFYKITASPVPINLVVENREYEGQRLDAFLASSVENKHSRSFFAELCKRGQVTVNNRSRSKSYRVELGDEIDFFLDTDELPLHIQPENITLNILHEDSDLIAINKPPGMVVHPAIGTPNGTFVNALLYHLGHRASEMLLENARDNGIDADRDTSPTSDCSIERWHENYQERVEIGEFEHGDMQKRDCEVECYYLYNDHVVPIHPNPFQKLNPPETPVSVKSTPLFLRPGIVHRLDKGTTGVLLAGKTPLAVDRLSKLFASRQIQKFYIAICIGCPGNVSITKYIGRSAKNRQQMCIHDGPPGKIAISHIKTLVFDGKLSVCLIKIETGRTHQIRVHLQDRKTPILGDDIYGNKDWNRRYQLLHSVHRPLLHAYAMKFIHPFTNQEFNLRAPLPPDMLDIIDKISRNHLSSMAKHQAKPPLIDSKTGNMLNDLDILNLFNLEASQEKISGKGSIPIDSLHLDDDEWTTFVLPEDEALFR